MPTFILSSVAQAAIWLFVLHRVRQRAYQEGFGEGMAAWAKVAKEFTVSKSRLKNQQEATARKEAPSQANSAA